jgi:HAMP domain-containing protein
MDNMNIPMINVDVFETERFNVDSYVKRVAAENIYASSIAEHKDKLNRLAQQTAEEIKQNVYKNYGNFMETSKEVGHLEGKMNQLRQSLEEQRKLLHLFKNLNVNSAVSMATQSTSPNASSSSSSLSLLLEQVEGCSLIAQKPNRNLLYHTDLEALNAGDFSVSHKLHAYLLTDSLLLTLPQRKRNKTNFNSSSVGSMMSSGGGGRRNDVNSTLLAAGSSANNYQYKFHAFYELHEIKIVNIEDSKEVRNAFQLYKFPECLAFRCANAHIKKGNLAYS